MKIGDKVIILVPDVGNTSTPTVESKARICNIDQCKITVMYYKDNRDLYKESFNIGQAIAKNLEIRILDNGQWRRSTKEDIIKTLETYGGKLKCI